MCRFAPLNSLRLTKSGLSTELTCMRCWPPLVFPISEDESGVSLAQSQLVAALTSAAVLCSSISRPSPHADDKRKISDTTELAVASPSATAPSPWLKRRSASDWLHCARRRLAESSTARTRSAGREAVAECTALPPSPRPEKGRRAAALHCASRCRSRFLMKLVSWLVGSSTQCSPWSRQNCSSWAFRTPRSGRTSCTWDPESTRDAGIVSAYLIPLK